MSPTRSPQREVPPPHLAALVAEHGECRCHSGLCYAVRGPHVPCLLCMHLTYVDICPAVTRDRGETS